MISVALGQTRLSSFSFNKCLVSVYFFKEICFSSRVEYTENVYRVEYTRENNFGYTNDVHVQYKYMKYHTVNANVHLLLCIFRGWENLNQFI